MKIRFPNETIEEESTNFNIKDFKLDATFDKVVFGWWKNIYIELNKKDYLKCLATQEK
jgi:hypothetical protein